jgi:hypothetical protein
MAHTFTITALNRIGAEARRRRDPMYFIREFGPMHLRWHMLAFPARPLGFLLYHWHVIQNFKKARGPQLWPGGVRPFTTADFANFGWPYQVTTTATDGDIESLAAFSLDIERWHNDAHMAIGMATGTPMMDPEENIRYLPFWRLHYFIDARFLDQLDNYDGRGSVARQIRRVERRRHSDVGRI